MGRYQWGQDPWTDPFTHLRRMQEEIDRLFGTYGASAGTEFPPMNVWAGTDGAVVITEIPGVGPEDIEVTVHENTLTLKGRREMPTNGKEVTYHRRERRFGPFGRTIALPFGVDSANVRATFANGVLSIQLPRPESDKPRRVQIATA
ncbi:MAG: Hsp20/alpha crystallin family protein [Alphaproteobacteria bacterium]|nr:Hsp20/alpha crystallin family protein [Alphaproteobacteria bacterium]